MTSVSLALGMLWFCRAAPGYGPAIRHHSSGDSGFPLAILGAILLAMTITLAAERIARWRSSRRDATP